MTYLLSSHDYVIKGSEFLPINSLKPFSKVIIPTPVYRRYDNIRNFFKHGVVSSVRSDFNLGNMWIGIEDTDTHPLRISHYNSHVATIGIDGCKLIEVRVKAGWGVGIYPHTWQMTGVDYEIDCMGEKIIHKSGLPVLLGRSFFQVSNLPLMDLDVGVISDKMFFGVKNGDFDVTYNKKMLHSRYKAFVCGTWGILLNDDLQFLALVLFRSVSDNDLLVDKFVHISDRRLLKEMMLAGGESK